MSGRPVLRCSTNLFRLLARSCFRPKLTLARGDSNNQAEIDLEVDARPSSSPSGHLLPFGGEHRGAALNQAILQSLSLLFQLVGVAGHRPWHNRKESLPWIRTSGTGCSRARVGVVTSQKV